MVIVSLTTTSERLRLCRITLLSLVRQARLPDEIWLWVSKSPYLADRGIKSEQILRNTLGSELVDHPALKILWTDNTGPYRKLLPCYERLSDSDKVVTADDDIYYGENWLKLLLEAEEQHPNSIVVARARRVRRNMFGGVCGYKFWQLILCNGVVHKDFQVTFGGGVVFNKATFTESAWISKRYLELAPTTDDLWFNRLLEVHERAIYVCTEASQELFFVEHQLGLETINFNKFSSLYRQLAHDIFLLPLNYFGFSLTNNDRNYKRLSKLEKNDL